MTQAYPLQWPDHLPRSKRREDGAFKIPLNDALDHLRRECRLMGAKNLVISTNIQMRQDGTGPLKNQREPDDGGIAVYFSRKGKTVCFACDRYRKIRSNIRSVGKTIESIRMIERYGSKEMTDQAFAGFTALPSPDMLTPAPNSAWWVILGCENDATEDQIRAAFKAQVRQRGGATVELNQAHEAGIAQRAMT